MSLQVLRPSRGSDITNLRRASYEYYNNRGNAIHDFRIIIQIERRWEAARFFLLFNADVRFTSFAFLSPRMIHRR